jgi:outer membrane protein assembly factor BamB
VRSKIKHGRGAHATNSLIIVLSLLVCSIARADDWPQWQGPKQDGIWRETGLVTTFPKDGLKVLWRVPVGGGYSGPAVAGGRVYVTDYTPDQGQQRPKNPFQRINQPGQERLQCIDQSTGRVLWAASYPVAYSMSYSAGPRATPAVAGDRVYMLGGEGDLRCLDTTTGKLIWATKSISNTPLWGFACNPLVDADTLFCITGGSDPERGHGVVTAFDRETGKVLWSALSGKEPGYSTPVLCQAGGVRQLIVWDPNGVNSLDPKTGQVYWSIPFGPAKMGLTIGTPRFYHDDQLGSLIFVSTQYEGSLMVKLDDQSPRASILWKRAGKNDRHTDALHSLMVPASLRDGHLYGIDAYGQLRCLDLKTGDRLWSTFDATTYDAGEQKWAAAFLIPIGETGSRYLIANEHGDLILADLAAAGYHEISRTHLLDPTNTDPGRPVLWCHPGFANRCVFWRNDKELICASLAASEYK